jgi:hypothetical protein
MFEPADVLLYALSSSRQLTWDAFKRIFNQVYVRQARTTAGVASEEPDRHLRRAAVSILEALGHCDVSFGAQGGEIYAAPAIIATLPTAGLPRAVLCGSRSPDTLRALRAAADDRIRISVNPHGPAVFAPCRIEIESDSVLAMEQFARSAGVRLQQSPAAWSILAMSGSVDRYVSTLNWSTRPDLNWPRSNFDPDRLHFVLSPRPVVSSDLILARYQNPSTGRYLFWLWDGPRSAAVDDPDWARYATLWKGGYHALGYDPSRASFAVPRTAPLPRLLSRAMSLCSGYAPAAMPTGQEPRNSEVVGVDMYRDVPPDVYEMCAAKLGQSPPEVSA